MKKFKTAVTMLTVHNIDTSVADKIPAQVIRPDTKPAIHEISPGRWHASSEECVLTASAADQLVVCLYDSSIRAGGMAHFGLTSVYGITGILNERSSIPGIFYMESLIGALVDMGSSRENLTASLFGGSPQPENIQRAAGHAVQITAGNIRFLQEYCLFEKIPVARNSLGTGRLTAIEFNTATGHVMSRTIREA